MERQAEYKLARQTGLTANYARVRVRLLEAEGDVEIAGALLGLHPVPPELRQAAVEGVRHALNNLARAHGPVSVVVEEIQSNPVDTRPSDVAFAACHAVWKALDDTGRNHPVLEERGSFRG